MFPDSIKSSDPQVKPEDNALPDAKTLREAQPLPHAVEIQHDSMTPSQIQASAQSHGVPQLKANASIPVLAKPGTPSRQTLSGTSLLDRTFSKVLTQLLPDLDPAEKTKLVQDYMQNRQTDPKITSAVKQASEAIQKQFGLSLPYVPGAKGVNIQAIAPEILAEARVDLITQTALEQQQTLTTIMTETPAIQNNPTTKRAYKEIMDVIALALQELEELQVKQIMTDLDATNQNAVAQETMIASSKSNADQQLSEARKQQSKQKKLSILSKVFQIAGPVLTALTTIVSAALTIASLGTLAALTAPLFLSGIAIGTAMTTYSILDATMDVTSKVIGALNDLADLIVDSLDLPDWAQPIVKGLAVAAVIAIAAVVAVVAVVATGGAAASNMASAATKAVAEAVKQAVKEVATKLVTFLATTLILSSNFVLEITGNLCDKLGLEGKLKQAVQGLILVAEVITVFGVAAKINSPKKPGTAAATAVSTVAQTPVPAYIAGAPQLVNKAIHGGIQLSQAAIKEFQTAMKQVYTLFVDFGNKMLGIFKDLKGTAAGVWKDLVDVVSYWTHFIGSMTKDTAAVKILTILKTGFGVTEKASQAAYYFTSAAMTSQMAAITIKFADLKQNDEILQALMDLIKELRSLLTGSIEKATSDLNDLADAMNAHFDKLKLILTRRNYGGDVQG